MIFGIKEVAAQDVLVASATRLEDVGTLARGDGDRLYRYVLAGASDLAPGKLVIAPAKVTNHTTLTVVSGALNAKSAVVTLGGTAATQDQYAGGTLVVKDGTGAGVAYTIKGHAAQTSTTGNLTVFLKEPLAVALDTTSRASLVANPYSAAVISSGAVALRALGVPSITIPATQYGWIQTRGLCAVLSDGVIGKASGAIISDAVNGAVEVEVAGTVTQRVGFAIEATVDTKYDPIVLTLE